VSTSLRDADFSYNNFSGVVPRAGVLTNLSAAAFRGNPRLCGAGNILGIAACGARRAGRRRVMLPAVVGIIAAVCVMLLCAAWCRSMAEARTTRQSTWRVGVQEQAEREHPRISYRELSDATGGFAESNVIGAGRFGRVYEGTLPGGVRVAVKVLVEPKGGVDGEVSVSFRRECEALRRTRHKNLIRVITTCSTASFNALVLPLMPHGSLEAHLYPHGDVGGGLGFGQLVSIASDVAEGMAYLHHYAAARVVHCDLKPSNVLLDEGMRAVVSDFGIARLVAGVDGDASSTHSITTGLLQGSVGYMAPGT
jgi:hypothetical protein